MPTASKAATRATTTGAYLGLLVYCAVTLVPIIWIFATSFKPPTEILAVPPTLLPKAWTPENYIAVSQAGDFVAYLVNSLVVATGSTVVALLLGAPAAFGFAQFPYRLSGVLLAFVLVARLFPPLALALPYFLQLRAIGLINTQPGLIIAYVPVVLPLMIWMLEGFFRDYPKDLIEAARIDGLSVVGTLVRIVAPTSLPAIGVATMFSFLVAWNEFLIALTVTRTPSAQTMPVGISTLITQFQTFWGQMAAVSAIYILPVLIVTIITQRGIISGMLLGASKG